MGVPPSLTILAFFRCRRRSWFFFLLAISSSSLFLARLSLSASPVGARLLARVASSSMSWRPCTYARMTAGSRIISVCHSSSISRLIRKTFLAPSGPVLISRSRSSDEPRLKAGDDAPTGGGDIAVGCGAALSFLTELCLWGALGSGSSSSGVNSGSSLLLSESN